MDTILTILKFIVIGIGVLIAIPLAIVLLGAALSLLGTILEFLLALLSVAVCFVLAAANAFFGAFFTPKE